MLHILCGHLALAASQSGQSRRLTRVARNGLIRLLTTKTASAMAIYVQTGN